jgi:hypothetical protein
VLSWPSADSFVVGQRQKTTRWLKVVISLTFEGFFLRDIVIRVCVTFLIIHVSNFGIFSLFSVTVCMTVSNLSYVNISNFLNVGLRHRDSEKKNWVFLV